MTILYFKMRGKVFLGAQLAMNKRVVKNEMPNLIVNIFDSSNPEPALTVIKIHTRTGEVNRLI
mgnify:CR=1 FL=1